VLSVEDTHETQILLDFVNKRFQTDVQISIPISIMVMRNLIFFGVLFVVLNAVAYCRYALVNQYLWIAMALFGYVVCTSGVVYNMQNGAPMFRFEMD
jgi:glucan phosphoethanolaminetransferase (alkaline phosphatase superfamily)